MGSISTDTMGLMNVLFLFGGLGLFLYGMKIMGEGLELAAGSKLRRLLEVLTNNKYLGALVGFIITAVIQSSSATTVMVVGFVNAGLMNLTQAVGVIMGANIGTTVTGILISLKLTSLAPVAFFLGVIFCVFSKKKTLQHVGMVIAGFGVLFLGMDIMSTTMAPLKNVPAFTNLFQYTTNPLIGILVGMLVTALIQSSSASIGIMLAMSAAGVITGLDQAIFILYGQNIGTCITALIASAGAKKTAKRAATIHLLFNVLGTLLFVVITLLPIGFVDLMKSVSGNIAQQIAATHVVFNVVSTAILLPLSNVLVKLAYTIVPGKEKQHEICKLKYIDDRILSTPTIAVAQVLNEVRRMAELASNNYQLAMSAFLKPDPETISEVRGNEEVLNFLNHTITDYLIKIHALDLQDNDSRFIGSMFHVVNDLERIGDHAENIIEYIDQFGGSAPPFSDAAIAEIKKMSDMVQDILAKSIKLFDDKRADTDLCDYITVAEEKVDEMNRGLRDSHVGRLNSKACRPESGMIFVEMLSNLERVSDHATNIAYALKEAM